MLIRAFCKQDLPAMTALWNAVVAAGNAFPQTDMLTGGDAAAFFAAQSFTAVAELEGVVVGLYILHPNHIGHCAHLANASFAVGEMARGRGVGEALVRHALKRGRELAFRVLQFNAVVASNAAAVHLYEKLHFVRLGVVPDGFRHDDGRMEPIVLFYHVLDGSDE